MLRERIFKFRGQNHNESRGWSVVAASEGIPKEHQESKSKDDTQNREKIVKKIIQYVKAGMTKEQAIDKVIKEEKELVEKFEYLTKHGLDLKVCFNNWVQDSDLILAQMSEKGRNER